jgi:hypothetical protein
MHTTHLYTTSPTRVTPLQPCCCCNNYADGCQVDAGHPYTACCCGSCAASVCDTLLPGRKTALQLKWRNHSVAQSPFPCANI